MALVAIRAVPNVVLHARMLWIRLSFRMANGADENLVVCRVRMAIGALRIVMRDAEPRVVEGGSEPARSCVTCCACRREAN